MCGADRCLARTEKKIFRDGGLEEEIHRKVPDEHNGTSTK